MPSTQHSSPNAIFILDFGSQYSQLIARRLRGLGISVELVPHTYPVPRIAGAKGIILSGGPDSVYEKGAATISKKIFELGIPMLGICYGMQLMAHLLGGNVQKSLKHEYGPAPLRITRESRLFKNVPKTFSV